MSVTEQGPPAAGRPLVGGARWHLGVLVLLLLVVAVLVVEAFYPFGLRTGPTPAWEGLWPRSRDDVLAAVLHLMSFVPVGVLLALARTPPLRLRTSVLAVLALDLVLVVGKVPLAGRHPGSADLVVQALGGALAAVLVTVWLNRVTHVSPVPQDDS